MPPREIFSRTARRLQRKRGEAFQTADRWIIERMEEELLARLAAVKGEFSSCLLIGGAELSARLESSETAVVACGSASKKVDVVCDEDRLPFADNSFDLVVAAGGLDSVNDVPGALILARRVLRPGGLFLGAMVGAGSLKTLRACLVDDVPRFHPQIDVRAAGDLLGRAGFALPVADQDEIIVRYSSAAQLFSDLCANGLRNCLSERAALGRRKLDEAVSAFAAKAQNAKTSETITLIYLVGWAP